MRKVELRNLTGHLIVYENDDGDTLFLKSRRKARIDSKMDTEEVVVVRGTAVPLLSVQEKKIVDLPPPQEGVLYVVSGIVGSFAANVGRVDVVVPSRVRRRDGGGVDSCAAFIRVKKG